MLTHDIVRILKRSSRDCVYVPSYNKVTINNINFRTLENDGNRRTTNCYVKYYCDSILTHKSKQHHQRNGKVEIEDENEMQLEHDDIDDTYVDTDDIDDDECNTAIASIIGIYTIRNHEHVHLPFNEYKIAYVNNYQFKGKKFIDMYTKLSDRDNITSSPIIDLNTVVPVNIAAWPNDNKDEVFAIQINNDDNIEMSDSS
jgi:hypothetical protein